MAARLREAVAATTLVALTACGADRHAGLTEDGARAALEQAAARWSPATRKLFRLRDLRPGTSAGREVWTGVYRVGASDACVEVWREGGEVRSAGPHEC